MNSTYIQALVDCRTDLDVAKATVKRLEEAIKALENLTGDSTGSASKKRGPRTGQSLRARVQEAMTASPEQRWSLDDLLVHLRHESPGTVVNAGALRTAMQRLVDNGELARGTDGLYELPSVFKRV